MPLAIPGSRSSTVHTVCLTPTDDTECTAHWCLGAPPRHPAAVGHRRPRAIPPMRRRLSPTARAPLPFTSMGLGCSRTPTCAPCTQRARPLSPRTSRRVAHRVSGERHAASLPQRPMHTSVFVNTARRRQGLHRPCQGHLRCKLSLVRYGKPRAWPLLTLPHRTVLAAQRHQNTDVRYPLPKQASPRDSSTTATPMRTRNHIIPITAYGTLVASSILPRLPTATLFHQQPCTSLLQDVLCWNGSHQPRASSPTRTQPRASGSWHRSATLSQHVLRPPQGRH